MHDAENTGIKPLHQLPIWLQSTTGTYALGATLASPLPCRAWGLQGQVCDFLASMRRSDNAFRVRMPAALMQLCTMVVRAGGLARSWVLLIDRHEVAFSWQAASASEVLEDVCTCKPS